jgi:hypothetical protein
MITIRPRFYKLIRQSPASASAKAAKRHKEVIVGPTAYQILPLSQRTTIGVYIWAAEVIYRIYRCISISTVAKTQNEPVEHKYKSGQQPAMHLIFWKTLPTLRCLTKTKHLTFWHSWPA